MLLVEFRNGQKPAYASLTRVNSLARISFLHGIGGLSDQKQEVALSRFRCHRSNEFLLRQLELRSRAIN